MRCRKLAPCPQPTTPCSRTIGRSTTPSGAGRWSDGAGSSWSRACWRWRRLLGSDFRIRSVLAAERKAERVRSLVGGRAPVLVRSDEQVEAIAGFRFHRGVLATAARRPLPGLAGVLEGVELVVVAEGLTDHENVGALFRNAAAFGVDAVLLDPATADPLYRRSVRVSLGHVLRVPWTRVPAWPDGLGELRRRGFELAGPDPGAASGTHRRRRGRCRGPPGQGRAARRLRGARAQRRRARGIRPAGTHPHRPRGRLPQRGHRGHGGLPPAQ